MGHSNSTCRAITPNPHPYQQCLQPTQDESVYGFAFQSLCQDSYGPLSPLSYTNISYLTTPLGNNLARLSIQVLNPKATSPNPKP